MKEGIKIFIGGLSFARKPPENFIIWFTFLILLSAFLLLFYVICKTIHT